MTRRSVPTTGMTAIWLAAGWLYVMPDFDRPNHSIIEWNAPCEPREPGKGHANDNAIETLVEREMERS